MSSPPRIPSDQSNKAKPAPRPDFEGNVAQFEAEFARFATASDPDFDPDLLRFSAHIQVPPFSGAASQPAEPSASLPESESGAIQPLTKAELQKPIRLSGPRVVESAVFGDTVQIGNDVRIKGSVFGKKSVSIGENCVVEGDLVSDGQVILKKGCRIEGSLTGAEIEIFGPLAVDGPLFARGDLRCRGSLTAQSIMSGGNMDLQGDGSSVPALVKAAASLILARNGTINLAVAVQLSGSPADPATQLFYIGWEGEQFRLSSAPLDDPQQGALLTVLTDSELEKMVAELAILE